MPRKWYIRTPRTDALCWSSSYLLTCGEEIAAAPAAEQQSASWLREQKRPTPTSSSTEVGAPTWCAQRGCDSASGPGCTGDSRLSADAEWPTRRRRSGTESDRRRPELVRAEGMPLSVKPTESTHLLCLHFSGWTWVSRLWKLSMMEVVATTGAISCVQSSSQIVTINKPTPNFLQAGCPSYRPRLHTRTHQYQPLKKQPQISGQVAGVPPLNLGSSPTGTLKDHRQRIPRFVIRRYLEKSIEKKLFCHLQSLQIKTIFQ